MEGLSRRLAAHAVNTRFEDLPPEAVLAAKRSVLDALGVLFAAGTLGQACGAFIDTARASGSGPCSVIGFGFSTSPSMAAMANASLSHALDYEDTHDASLVHPNGTGIPAALAAAQAFAAIHPDNGLPSGRDFITALAVGADISCRLGMAMADDDTKRGWTMRPLLGTWGATAAAGRLLGLNEHQMLQAFALAFHQATCSSGFLAYAPSHVREIRDAFGAQAAITAAQLALRGVEAYDQPIEGAHGLFAMYAGGLYDADRLVANLGRTYEGANVSFKPWPSCRGTHAFIEGALALRARHPELADAARIARVDAVVSPTFRILCEPLAIKRAPSTANGAKFSVPFTAAIALVHGQVGLAHYLPDALKDPAVLALAQRVHCTVGEGWGFEESLRGELTVTLADGRVLPMVRVDQPLGDPAKPMPPAALRQKFMDCVRHAATPVGPEQAAEIADAVDALDGAPDLAPLLHSLR